MAHKLLSPYRQEGTPKVTLKRGCGRMVMPGAEHGCAGVMQTGPRAGRSCVWISMEGHGTQGLLSGRGSPGELPHSVLGLARLYVYPARHPRGCAGGWVDSGRGLSIGRRCPGARTEFYPLPGSRMPGAVSHSTTARPLQSASGKVYAPLTAPSL